MKYRIGKSLSFFPQCVLENIMMTSLLADESVIVKNKLIMNFMNEFMNPPCNSSLATLFESSCEEVAQCRERPIPYLYALGRTIAYAYRMLLPNFIHASPILIRASPVLIH